MVVCIEPELGFFFRINSEPKWQTPVKLEKRSNPFLKTDSYLECGAPLELDEYTVDEALRGRGVMGEVYWGAVPAIWDAVRQTKLLSAADKEAVRKALGVKDKP